MLPGIGDTDNAMQGIEVRCRWGYKRARIGQADPRFASVLILVSVIAVVCLGYLTYQGLQRTHLQIASFVAIYAVATILYMNVGVWLHEQLHCLAYWRSVPRRQMRIHFERRYILALSGYYRVNGAIPYRTQKRALLAPLVLTGILSAFGLLGSLILPNWWLPVLLTMAIASVVDMVHDIYMVLKMRPIGDKGRYWDKGSEIHVVWKVNKSGSS